MTTCDHMWLVAILKQGAGKAGLVQQQQQPRDNKGPLCSCERDGSRRSWLHVCTTCHPKEDTNLHASIKASLLRGGLGVVVACVHNPSTCMPRWVIHFECVAILGYIVSSRSHSETLAKTKQKPSHHSNTYSAKIRCIRSSWPTSAL